MSKNTKFLFKIIAKYKHARAGEMITPHGVVKTPTFMPVGTQASVKALSPDDLQDCGAEIILGGNTYHMYLRPGTQVIKKAGGMHQFMHWQFPMLTDSGGFQVFTLGTKITDDGVWFKSHLDGTSHFFNAQKSIKIQKIMGADIIMAFDQCAPDKLPKSEIKKAMLRTHQWLKLSQKYWHEFGCLSTTTNQYQALFGIIQGGVYKDLRLQAAEFVSSLDLPGIAIGGETIGFNMPKTLEIADWIKDYLKLPKPIYMMGLSQKPQDIIEAVMAGVDIFDCVAPTRMARHGGLYQGRLRFGETVGFTSDYPNGYLNINKLEFKEDQGVIAKNCSCPVCQKGYTRSYLRHLFKSGEQLYYRLASIHNVYFMLDICRNLRKFIIKKNETG